MILKTVLFGTKRFNHSSFKNYGKVYRKFSTKYYMESDRVEILNEVHSRPFFPIDVECNYLVTHVVNVDKEEREEGEEWRVLQRFCEEKGLEIPNEWGKHCIIDFDGSSFKFERHSEFTTFTYFEKVMEGTSPLSFNEVQSDLNDMLFLYEKCDTLVKMKIFVHNTNDNAFSDIDSVFDHNTVVASNILSDSASIFSDWKIKNEYTQFVVQNKGLERGDMGLILLKIMELEQYRVMSLMGLPLSKRVGKIIQQINEELFAITSAMENDSVCSVSERELLTKLLLLSKRVEKLRAMYSHRFNASKAYYDIFEKRLNDLNEKKIVGHNTVGSFLKRRLDPAIKTCTGTDEKIQKLIQTLSTTGSLLQTLVNIELQEQNHKLLESMESTVRRQYHLQETIEGLSVVAISYYTISLWSYLIKCLIGMDLVPAEIPYEMIMAVSIPVAITSVWFTTNKIKKKYF